jgi:predicted DsbA family dithiol-disulfide isomerase
LRVEGFGGLEVLNGPMQVEIWSDVVCPWCYIGKRRFERALERFEHADAVEIVWRSFELDPTAPTDGDLDLIGRLAAKYGVPRTRAEAMNQRVTDIAETEGLHYRLDIARPGRTFDAHRLLHFAADHGRQDALKEALLAAYQTQGEPIADHGVLTRVAVGAGLDEDDVRQVLSGDKYASDVRHDEREARDLGINGVPAFVLDRRYAVSGAQPSEILLDALERAWADRSERADPTDRPDRTDG